MEKFMREWSARKAELEHVETFEEANDFEVYDPEDDDFFHDVTPYELHDMPEIPEDHPASFEGDVESNENSKASANPPTQQADDSPDQEAPLE